MNYTEVKTVTYADFKLPAAVISKVDISHLMAEVERIDNVMTTDEVQNKDNPDAQKMQPTLSQPLSDFITQNNLSLDDSRNRTELIKELRLLKDKVPVIHMTFSVEADPESLQTLSAWLRESIHPQAVISVGMQPSLIAGVYLRTPNHVRDLSLRSLITGKHDDLVKELETLRG